MSSAPSAPLFSPGSTIENKWVVIELIGKGGMGEVYRAHQINLKRDVAIKIVSEDLLKSLEDNPEESALALKRLQREVQAMAQLRHPNIVQIYDYGSIEAAKDGKTKPMQYIVMEYVPGNTLRFTMSEEGFAGEVHLLREWLVKYFFPVLDGVAAIHRSDIVHRDLKPENVLMDGEAPKITDFGLARGMRMRAITNSWDVKGTMNYMAPEQFLDFRKAGVSVDIYALGKVLYESVEGKISSNVVPLKSVGLRKPDHPFLLEIDAIVLKATAEDPEKRFQMVEELRLALSDALKTLDRPAEIPTPPLPPKAATRWTWVGVGAVLIALLAMTAWHLLGNPGIGERSAPDLVAEAPALPATEPILAAGDTRPSEIIGRDGRPMILIQADKAAKGGVVASLPFYIDRSKVSNHHYVEFLNKAQDQVTVRDGVVRSGDEIWLYLGTGTGAHEQIYQEQGVFHLRDKDHADLPVVRVTYNGAQAYAALYGKRLPTEMEWRLAAHRLQAEIREAMQSSPAEVSSSAMSEHMQSMGHSNGTSAAGTGMETPMSAGDASSERPSPRVDFGLTWKEWIASSSDRQESEQVQAADWKGMTSGTPFTVRYRWEGFEDVGFRTVEGLESR